MGDGKKIRFWEDTWCSREPLCEAFPVLYSIADSKGAFAVDLWVGLGDFGAWGPKFLRSFNDWELDTIQAFIVLTSNNNTNPMAKDNMIWKGDVSGCFSVKAYFNRLEGDLCFSPYQNVVESLRPL